MYGIDYILICVYVPGTWENHHLLMVKPPCFMVKSTCIMVNSRFSVVKPQFFMAHRIHGAGIYTNIKGNILMGSMLPDIAAPWILWVVKSPSCLRSESVAAFRSQDCSPLLRYDCANYQTSNVSEVHWIAGEVSWNRGTFDTMHFNTQMVF